jgi:hypothetical protein
MVLSAIANYEDIGLNLINSDYYSDGVGYKIPIHLKESALNEKNKELLEQLRRKTSV